MVATRYCGGGAVPASLYYASGSGWEETGDQEYIMTHRERLPRAHIISSEPLSVDSHDWVTIPPQSVAVISPESDFFLHPIPEILEEEAK